MTQQILIHQSQTKQWLRFENPVEVFKVHHHAEIFPTLAAIEAYIEQGFYAAGFISYEASPAFDPALHVHPHDDFPLLWFGVYPTPEQVSCERLLSEQTSSPYTLGPWSATCSRPEFKQNLAQIKRYIAQGDSFQVNYTFRLKSTFEGNAFSLFIDLLQTQPSQYAAWIDIGQYAICSTSPELFFSLSACELTVKPMKGTAARGKTLAEDQAQAAWLQNSPKNRAENVMIVDMVRNDLSRVATLGSVRVPKLFEVERYPTLWQMTSTVCGLTHAPLSQIFASLFPCASIVGAPKPRTMEIIAQLETSPRRIYTGSIGYWSPKRQAQFNVAIRTVLIDRAAQTAEYGVGSGIVWDSQSEEEYNECCVKTIVLTHKAPKFSLLETILWTPKTGYFLLSYHWQRLQESAEYFGFPLDLEAIDRSLRKTEAHLPDTPQKLRLLVDEKGRWHCEVQPWKATFCSRPMNVKLAPTPVDSSNPFLYHKTTFRQVYEQAHAAYPDCDDVLLWNESGEVTESCRANIVLRLADRWVTPPIACGLLPGTFRAWLLEQQQIEERAIACHELEQASQLYLINSVRGWQPAQLLK